VESPTQISWGWCLDALRAHLLELAGDREAAIQHYRAAAFKTANLAERNYLLTQAARHSG
jgi:predicted RNA polymerase sigma factor